MLPFINKLFASARQESSRSTIVSTLVWQLAALSATVVGLVAAQAPTWVTVVFVVMAVVSFANYNCAYWYFARKSPDALRTEKFSLTKMAIERSAKGDDVSGLIIDAASAAIAPPAISPPQLTEGPLR